ncbi:gly-9, partial [Symbiodinium microadriaticum]
MEIELLLEMRATKAMKKTEDDDEDEDDAKLHGSSRAVRRGAFGCALALVVGSAQDTFFAEEQRGSPQSDPRPEMGANSPGMPGGDDQEVIVVDDGSNPPLEQLFQQSENKWAQDPQCKGKVRFLRHETTTGLMAAKLTGGREARGDVIAFIDCHCAPQPNWHQEILAQVRLNPRRMVVPAITDLDLDTFDERADSQVNAKCYLTLDADFKWFDDESDFIPTISGGLVAMGREWFNATGGFDEEMHGWGGENLDQSLRAWLCGGDIVRAKTSRVAHMWRTGKDRRTATHYVIKARGTNNRGRVVAAWFGPFREVSRSSVKEDQVLNYNGFKKRLHCLPFSYFLYRFRKLYIEGGVIAREYFRLQEVASGLCLGRRTLGNCTQGGKLFLQRGNVDRCLLCTLTGRGAKHTTSIVVRARGYSQGPPSISSDSFGDGTLLLSPITNRKCRLEGEARDSVKRVLLLDFHNTLDRYFTPGRKQQHAIPWPSTRPTLLPEVTDFVKHCVTAASQNESFTCVVVLSLIHKSQESEAWLRDTIHNTLEEVGEIGDTERCLFDLLIVSRERIGPKGKLSVAFCNKRRAARRVVHAFLGAILPRAFSLAT